MIIYKQNYVWTWFIFALYRVITKSFPDFLVITVCNQGNTLCPLCISVCSTCWMILTVGREIFGTNSVSLPLLQHSSPTWNALGLNPCLRYERPVTNCVTNETIVKSVPTMVHRQHHNRWLTGGSIGIKREAWTLVEWYWHEPTEYSWWGVAAGVWGFGGSYRHSAFKNDRT